MQALCEKSQHENVDVYPVLELFARFSQRVAPQLPPSLSLMTGR